VTVTREVEFVDQLCQDSGGPCSYTGLSMKESHTNMGVTNGEFDAFMEDPSRFWTTSMSGKPNKTSS
jgi:hypothetical protein